MDRSHRLLLALVVLVLAIAPARAQEGEENHAPDCSTAVASVTSLWPPNHQMVPLAVEGVTDADDDAVDVTVTRVAQDEALVGEGDGDTCPDAEGVDVDETVSLRAERSGQGNGRVYHVAFLADDANGGTCTGEVVVCVPHDQGQGASCGDGGALVDSLGGGVLCDGEACYADECEPLEAPAPCSGEPLPPTIGRRVDRAVALLERAAFADREEQEIRWRLRAARLLRRASAVASKAATRGGLAPGCGDALAQQLGGSATCAACLLPPE